jgi:hypothetical protein
LFIAENTTKQWLELKNKSFMFVFPDADDIADVHYDDILFRVPDPVRHGGTTRVARHFVFPIGFDDYKEALR